MPICFGWCHDNKNLNDNHKDPLFHPTATGSQPSSLDNTYIEIEERIGPRKPTTSIDSELSATNSKEATNKAPNLSSVWDHIYWKNPKLLFEDILTMGNCLFGGAGLSPIIDHADGNEQDFHNRYIEDRVLGEGEFGVVKLVHDMREPDESKNTLACKVLRKGVVFKDNTLYAPLKREVLVCEIEILRTLSGQHYCIGLTSVYETARAIFMVLEYCAGGEMMEYVSKQQEDLRTDDVSRIAFQMLDAVNHCAQHNIIHRDIKPENIMFVSPQPGADLRLIDFGSGTNKVVEGLHTTFAGSAFYISPEMFQRTYSLKTDVWSVGVSLYVLVAGYPSECLQRAFNKLQSANRNLRDLPNLPDNMPDSFYDMLEGLLTYRHKKRKSAGELLTHEFVQFHKTALSVEQIAMNAQEMDDVSALPGITKNYSMTRTTSVSLRGSVGRHTLFLDYQKYQRSLTTLLATLLNKKELMALLTVLGKFLSSAADGESKNEQPETTQNTPDAIEKRLEIIHIRDLKSLLKKEKHEQVLAMIAKLPGSGNYETFAYDVGLLKEFVREDDDGGGGPLTSSLRTGGGRKKRFGSGLNRSHNGGSSLRGSYRGGLILGRKPKRDALDGSLHSVGSLRGRQNFANLTTTNPVPVQ